MAIAFAALVIYRAFVLYGERKTNGQVAIIHATKLTLDDVMGKNMPPPPAHPDATVAGVDANGNGIRDDVELAIFAAYPNSARTRAVLLQYALALQRQATSPISNTDTVIAAVQEEDRAYICVGKIFSRENMNSFLAQTENLRSFVKTRQLNTEARKSERTRFYNKIDSYASLEQTCDIDYSTLPN